MLQRDLRSRLAFFDKKHATRVEKSPSPLSGDREDFLVALGGELLGRGASRYLKIEEPVEKALVPGAPADCVPAEAWFRLSGRPAPGGNHWVILDTETTGLQTGAGTLVFLVGLLHWRDEGARLVQYFIPEPAGESEMLRDLWRELEPVDALVSFNGLAFDCSRLRTRGILSRLDPRVLDKPQLDLMHPARRIAAGWLPDCRLKSLEERLLGREREDDLPGSAVPEVYRSWLSEGRQPDLPRVLEHNRHDVENLMHLAAVLAAIYSDAEDPLELPPSAHHRLGRTLLARERVSAAKARFERAMREGEPTVACRAALELARLHKRAGEWKRAEEIYRHCAQRWPSWVPARVELAKIQEHRRKDLAAALKTVTGVLEILVNLPKSKRDEVFPATVDELEYRRERLSRRLSKVAPS
jgi:hypothetical protein